MNLTVVPKQPNHSFGGWRLPIVAPSLGGVETLITRPCTTSHAGMAPGDRQRLGITDSLIRVSIGIEAELKIILEDFEQASVERLIGRCDEIILLIQ